MTRSYRIEPRPPELGGGWRLYLLEDDQEAGGGVFPASGYDGADDQAAAAYGDALETGEQWAGEADPAGNCQN